MRPVSAMLLVAALLSLGQALTSGSPALASCAEPVGSLGEQLEGAEAVFVGTVVGLPGDDRLADVAVEAVWRGDVAEAVAVHGSPAAGDPNAGTSVDRSYRAGERYLFAVQGSGARFEDSICSPTRVWEADLNRHRPEGVPTVVGPAVSPGSAGLPPPGPGPAPAPRGAVWALAAVAAAGALALLAWRVRRAPG